LAVGKYLSFRDSWRYTKGNTWRVFWISLFALILPLAIILLIKGGIFIILWFLGLTGAEQDVPVLMIAHAALDGIASAVFVMISGALWMQYYARLVPDAPVPTLSHDPSQQEPDTHEQ